VSGFLLDTNILSELRKGSRASDQVRTWFDSQQAEELYVSVLTLGEIRRGIERIRDRDPKSAAALEKWLERLKKEHAARILPITEAVADRWGCLGIHRPLPTVDALLAATALEHNLVLATGNESDVSSTDVAWVNPFTGKKS
jgi:predicted nucleic acid-binding protein